MKKYDCVVPSQTGWIEVELDNIEIDFLWKSIENKGKSHKSELVGNIDSSYEIFDKDNWFYNNTLVRLCDAYAESFGNIGSNLPTLNKHPYFLQSMWGNYLKQTEFNPTHLHKGVYSFVIWMQIPTEYNEQKENPIAKNTNLDVISNFSFNYRENVQEDSSSESLLTLYEAAWFQTYNGSFNSMFKWQPLIGSNASFWDPNGEVFQDEVVSNGNYVNPFLDTVSAGRIGAAQYILDLFFEEDFDFGDLSYALAYYPSGQRIYCGSSLDLLGIDACSPNARPDFFLNIDSYIQEIAKRPKQSVVEIKDITGENAGTLNQALAFPVKASGETLVVILLGIDIRKSLEIFEDEFEVRTAVKTQDDLISLNEYYAQLDNDEDNLFDQENFKLLSEKALSFREQNGSRFSSKDTELGSSIT